MRFPKSQIRTARAWVVAAVAFLVGAGIEAAPEIHAGELDGVPYFIATPGEGITPRGWLLYAHGYKPESYPLSATLPIEEAPWSDWLDAGWTLLSTAYRRNGWLLQEAAEDLQALETWWGGKAARPPAIVLWGESMGGAVVTWLAETSAPSRYTGAIGVSAALIHPEIAARVEWTYEPAIPLLLASNENEMADPRHYGDAVEGIYAERVAVWEIARAGHVNLTPAEQRSLLTGLVDWAAGGAIELRADATEEPTPFVSEAQWEDGAATVPVRRIDPDFGNVDLGLNVADLDRLGVGPGAWVVVRHGETTVRARRGATYGDVSQGEWIALVLAGGQVRLAVNYGNAAEALGLTAEGQTVSLSAPEK